MNERISSGDKKTEVKSQNPVHQIRRKAEPSQSMNSPVDRILFIQRTIGNQAVGNLIKSGALQAKLRIGQPGDIHEQEADRVAEQVMRMPDDSSGKDIKIQRKCPKCLNGLRELIGNDKKDEKLQKTETAGKTPEVTTYIEAKVNALKGSGQPLPESILSFFEPRFGQDFSQVRVHTDAKAAESARAVKAKAYTVGQDVVFGVGQYAPRTGEGDRLMAHELAHVVQQSRQFQAKLQRVPAPPTYGGSTGTFDRSKVQIGEIPNVVASTSSGQVTLSPPVLTATVTINHPDVTHLSWELYDASDQFVNGMSTLSSSPDPTSFPYVIHGGLFNGSVTQGRYALRCVGRRQGKPVVFADRTFYIWTSAPTSLQDLASLSAIKSSPASRTLNEVGAAYARSMMLEHQQAVATTGTGKYMGSQVPGNAPSGAKKTDCTEYVLEVLREAFKAKGRTSDWMAIYNEAVRTSAGQFKGTELLRALQSKAGWKAVFWAPDPRNPADASAEHPSAFKEVRERGTYYGIPVDKSKSVIGYRPTSPTRQEIMTNLDQLRGVPLGVIAARGGTHMTILLNGDVYEVHWDKPATDPDVITATPLEKWEWQSGMVVMPPESFTAAFGP